MEKDDQDEPAVSTEQEQCEVCGKTSSGTCSVCRRGSFCSSECCAKGHPKGCAIFASPVPRFPVEPRFTATEASEYAKALVRDGHVVIPVYDTLEARKERHGLFTRALETFPEYRRDRRGVLVKYVKSQFGGLGNPSSFHNTFVRNVRKELMLRVAPVFSALRGLEKDAFLNDTERNETRLLEQIVDRMRVHMPGEAPSKESWHRDTTPTEFTTRGDSIFGGWVNFDADEDQFFSCITGTHVKEPLNAMKRIDYAIRNVVTGSGFKKYGPEDQKRLGEMNIAAPVRIPPGHLLIFYQEIVHEVLGKPRPKNKPPSYRLFTGWRLTHDTQPFKPTHPSGFYSDMATPRIKSGQAPALYSVVGNWAGTGTDGLEQWSKDTFKPELLVQERMATTQKVYTIVPRAFVIDPNDNKVPHTVNWSLHDIAQKLGNNAWPMNSDYPAYSPEEEAILTPNRTWTIDGRRVTL